MSISNPDFSPLKKIGLTEPAMGVKFSYFRPEGIPMLDKDVNMSLCEIFRKSQRENTAFYFCRENNETCVGKKILGMEEFDGMARSGQIGKPLGVFNDTRANAHFYQHTPKLDTGTTNYVSFAPVDKMNFNPDVLIISARPAVAEIVMRAATYSTGMMYTSTCTPVMGCAWFLVEPFRTGKINFVIPAFVHGPHGRKLYDDDATVLVCIPYHWIPTVLASLDEMAIELEGHKSKEAYYSEFEGILADLAERGQNP